MRRRINAALNRPPERADTWKQSAFDALVADMWNQSMLALLDLPIPVPNWSGYATHVAARAPTVTSPLAST